MRVKAEGIVGIASYFDSMCGVENRLPMFAEASVRFETTEERDAFVARFPKYVGVKSSTLTMPADGVSYANGSKTVPTASFRTSFAADGVNGGKNEAGVKRFKTFLSKLSEAETEWDASASNAYRSASEAIDAICGVGAHQFAFGTGEMA